MGLKRKIVLPAPTVVALTKTSIINLPLNYRYHAVFLVATGNNGASVMTNLPTTWITDIRVRMNGRIQRSHSADHLNKLNLMNGSQYGAITLKAVTAGQDYGQVIPIYFAEPWREDQKQKEFLAVPARRLTDFAIEVDIGTAVQLAASGTPTPSLTAYAIVDTEDQPGADKNGLIVGKVFRLNLAGATTASFALDINNLDRRDLYQTIVVDTSASVGTTGVTANAAGLTSTAKLTVKSSGLPILEVPQDAEISIHAQQALNATRQFAFQGIFDSDDPIESGLNANGLPDLQVRIETGNVASLASANWTLLTERAGPPE